jgi:hypothetical protein
MGHQEDAAESAEIGRANEIKDRPSHGTVFSHAFSRKFSQ